MPRPTDTSASSAADLGSPSRSEPFRRAGRALERLIGADVHRGEWQLVLLFFANLFLLLTAYYVLKVIREPLILLGGGAVSRSYARGLQAVLLVAVIPAYGLLANRLEPDRLVKWIMGFFVACLGGFFVLGRAGLPVGFAFFVWLGIFSTLAIAQFWSLANDLLTHAEGKRLFPLVAAGGTIGGIVGSQISARALGWLDPYALMVVAAALLSGCIGLTHWGHTAGLRHRVRVPSEHRSAPRDRRGGFTLVVHDRYLLLIAVAVVLLNLINTTGDFILAQMVASHAETVATGAANAAALKRQFIGSFYGDFQTYVTTLTALAQIFLVGRLWKRIGVAHSLLVVPLMAVGGYGVATLLPSLMLVAVLKVFENSADYSLQNTIQQALFLPTSRDAKYKAKAAIDTVGVRLGDLTSTGLVFLGVQAGLSTIHYAAANFAAGLIWLVLVLRLARRHRLLTQNGQHPATPVEPPAHPGLLAPNAPLPSRAP
jgi:AAA family ATP:ADP antiporter